VYGVKQAREVDKAARMILTTPFIKTRCSRGPLERLDVLNGMRAQHNEKGVSGLWLCSQANTPFWCVRQERTKRLLYINRGLALLPSRGIKSDMSLAQSSLRK
jgi:hypothetical protein